MDKSLWLTFGPSTPDENGQDTKIEISISITNFNDHLLAWYEDNEKKVKEEMQRELDQILCCL